MRKRYEQLMERLLTEADHLELGRLQGAARELARCLAFPEELGERMALYEREQGGDEGWEG